jgi:hypothetical protein
VDSSSDTRDAPETIRVKPHAYIKVGKTVEGCQPVKEMASFYSIHAAERHIAARDSKYCIACGKV